MNKAHLCILLVIFSPCSLEAMNAKVKRAQGKSLITLELSDGFVILSKEEALLSKLIASRINNGKNGGAQTVALETTTPADWELLRPLMKGFLKTPPTEQNAERKKALALLRKTYAKKGREELERLLKAAKACKLSELTQLIRESLVCTESSNGNSHKEACKTEAEGEVQGGAQDEAQSASQGLTNEQNGDKPRIALQEASCGACGAKTIKNCGGCLLQPYCSEVCIRRDWGRHKIDCQKLCPLCPACSKEKPTMLCERCSLPLCSDQCAETAYHKERCADRIAVREAYQLAYAPNYKDVFQIAISTGDDALFDRILRLELVTFKDGICSAQYALHAACGHNRLHMVKALIAHGASLTHTNPFGVRPFHQACVAGSGELVQFLIERGAVIDQCDLTGSSQPIHYACDGNNREALDVLLRHTSALKDAKTPEHFTPLHILCDKGYHELAKHLIETYHPDEKAMTILGNTAIHLAARSCPCSFMDYLIGRGHDKEALTQNNETPLHFAASAGQVEMVRHLCSLGVDTTVKTKKNKLDPFFAACSNGHTSVVQFFHEERGIDIKTVRHLGSPLHWACVLGYIPLIKYLIERGASTDSLDDSGKTPLAAARARKQNAVVELLQKEYGITR